MFLQDITCKLHEDGYGFDIIFTFEKNDYFTNTELKKTYKMTKQNIIERCEGTVIVWKEGKNITEKKVKKKSKNKKNAAARTVTKTVEQESFFNYFKTIDMPDEKDLKEEQDEEEKTLGDKMDEDFDMGNEFKDQLIPLALEYYMEVIEDEEDDCDSCEGEHQHDKDSDEDDEPKASKGKKKGGNKKGEEAAAGQEK